MADVFISYSKKNPEPTEDLAAELKSRGISVWWDTELLPVDSFKDVILQELTQAKAVIVIWTSSSTRSDWVYSEAARARAANKLIQLRATDLDTRDVPPPFDALHIASVADHKAIFAALAKFGVYPSTTGDAAAGGATNVTAQLEIERWALIKNATDPQRFRDFLARFPNGEFADIAKERLEGLEWARVKTSEHLATLKAFVAEFPNGANAQAARTKLDALARKLETSDWPRVRNLDDIAEYQRYLENFPTSAHRPEAEQRLAVLREEERVWSSARDQTNTGAAHEYLARFPKGRYAAEARRWLAEREAADDEAAWRGAMQTGTPEALRYYISTRPNGRFIKAAQAALAAMGDTTVKPPIRPQPWYIGAGAIAAAIIGVLIYFRFPFSPAPDTQPSPSPSTQAPAPATLQTGSITCPSSGTGMPGNVFKFGIWNLACNPRSDGDPHFSAWTDDRKSAVEMVGSSNGWWNLREGDSYFTIYSNTDKEPDNSFFWRGWEDSLAPQQAGTGFSFRFGSAGTPSNVAASGTSLILTLSDHGVITIDAASPAIHFKSSSGKTVDFGGGGGSTSGTQPAVVNGNIQCPASGMGRPGGVYKFGIWNLACNNRSDGDPHFSAWTDDTASAIEMVGSSNGWWDLKEGDKFFTIYSNTRKDPDNSFYWRGWEDGLAPQPAASAFSFSFGSQATPSTVAASGTTLTMTLSDKATITVDASSPAIRFHSSRTGQTVNFGPQTAAPAPAAPTVVNGNIQCPASGMGKPGNVFKFGIWNLACNNRGDGDPHFSAWTDDRKKAVEIVGSSNGWWNLRDGDQYFTIFSTADKQTDQSFFWRGWEDTLAPQQAAGSFSFTLGSQSTPTKIAGGSGALTFTLSDSGELQLNAKSAAIKFRTYDKSKNVTF